MTAITLTKTHLSSALTIVKAMTKDSTHSVRVSHTAGTKLLALIEKVAKSAAGGGSDWETFQKPARSAVIAAAKQSGSLPDSTIYKAVTMAETLSADRLEEVLSVIMSPSLLTQAVSSNLTAFLDVEGISQEIGKTEAVDRFLTICCERKLSYKQGLALLKGQDAEEDEESGSDTVFNRIKRLKAYADLNPPSDTELASLIEAL